MRVRIEEREGREGRREGGREGGTLTNCTSSGMSFVSSSMMPWERKTRPRCRRRVRRLTSPRSSYGDRGGR